MLSCRIAFTLPAGQGNPWRVLRGPDRMFMATARTVITGILSERD